MKPSFKLIIAAILSAVCAAAGTVATYAPDGGVRDTAATIANQCEAGGVTAYPVFQAPEAGRDAGTEAPAPQVPTAPSSPAVQPRTRASRTEPSMAPQRWPWAFEAWPGESNGWA